MNHHMEKQINHDKLHDESNTTTRRLIKLSFNLLTNPRVINRFIFGHGVVINYITISCWYIVTKFTQNVGKKPVNPNKVTAHNLNWPLHEINQVLRFFFWLNVEIKTLLGLCCTV